jgi:hypothetical protein
MCSLAAYQLLTNKTQCQDIFSISQQLGTRLRWVIRIMLPRVPLSVSFIQKRVTSFKEILYSSERAKKVPVKIHPEISVCLDMGESHICLGDVLPEHSNMVPLQNHYTDLETNEYHTQHMQGKACKCKWQALTSSCYTLMYTKSGSS